MAEEKDVQETEAAEANGSNGAAKSSGHSEKLIETID